MQVMKRGGIASGSGSGSGVRQARGAGEGGRQQRLGLRFGLGGRTHN